MDLVRRRSPNLSVMPHGLRELITSTQMPSIKMLPWYLLIGKPLLLARFILRYSDASAYRCGIS